LFSANVDVAMRVALAVEAGSAWGNDRARLHDEFEEGGFKASGVGRMRGLAVMDDFIEFTHIRLHPGDSPAAGSAS
jgi:betaine-aldehyde dehydrogenase